MGAIGHDIANSGVTRHLQGGQDQVGVPHVPLLGHGDPIKTQIWHVGAIGHDIANNKVTRPLQDGQDQVSVPQVPLLGHGEALGTCNLGCRGIWP